MAFLGKRLRRVMTRSESNPRHTNSQTAAHPLGKPIEFVVATKSLVTSW